MRSLRSFAALTAFLLVFVFVLARPAAAQNQDVEGSADSPLISRYPGSYIYRYIEKDFDTFLFPLGNLVNGSQLSRSQQLQGKVTRILYVSPPSKSVLEVYSNYASALESAGFEVLYKCADQRCGDGTVTLFEDQQLDWDSRSGQRQLSAKLSRPNGDVYVSLHVWGADFGGQSVAMTQLDIIEMKPMATGLVSVNAASLANDIDLTGHVAVYGIYFDTGKADLKPASNATLEQIAKLLSANPNLKLYVVGHTDNVGEFAANMDLSLRRAEAVTQALVSKYSVLADRLKACGVGPLVPVASNHTEAGRARNRRVELVEQ